MMRFVFLVFVSLLSYNFGFGQELFLAKNGEISFYSDTPVEAISAVNKSVVAMLNTSTNEVAVKVVINQFSFPHKLMQEHFNENYLDTEKFPNATFLGKINEKLDWKTEGIFPVTVLGKLTIHGTTVVRNIAGKIVITKDEIYLSGNFNVLIAEHKITVPSLLTFRIADAILVKVKLSFFPYSKS